jgi:hypothetical protein
MAVSLWQKYSKSFLPAFQNTPYVLIYSLSTVQKLTRTLNYILIPTDQPFPFLPSLYASQPLENHSTLNVLSSVFLAPPPTLNFYEINCLRFHI